MATMFENVVLLLLVDNLGSSPGGNWPLYMGGKQRQKKQADHFRFVGVRFNKGTDRKEVCFGKVQDEYILALANQNLYITVYTKV